AHCLSSPPHTPVADVGSFRNKVMRDLALQPDTPLQDSRRPPGARIHHVRGIADGARQRLLTRIEVRERDRVRHAVAQREWRGAVFRRAEWLRRTKITGFGRVIIGLRVRSEERRVGKECRSRWGTYD